MPFPMRIQPIDAIRHDVVKPPVLKSRLKRLFDRPFNSVMRNSSAEKQAPGGEKDGGTAPEFEPSSVCLDKMVQNFMEDNNDKQSIASAVKCGRHRCNCFNGKSNDSSDDEIDFFSDSLAANSSVADPSDSLKSLIPCASVEERNLLAETSRIVEKNSKTCKRKDELRKVVSDGLVALGYNASVCKSKWEKTSSVPAGEHEYIDVITEGGERLIIEVDFRSEFEIARSTGGYKSILQCLPSIFVGKSDRLLQIISIASEAARQSLKKKGMHIAPWRKAEYIKSKWLGPHTRTAAPDGVVQKPDDVARPGHEVIEVLESEMGELDLIFGEETSLPESGGEKPSSPVVFSGEIARSVTWQLPELRPKSLERGNKMVVTGLAALLNKK
ncbi:hypothetical protein SASPL_116620 [Salvia splendens]|uniref:Uncharacterized protein n=1 Tax=Salvia splendens TaxID=180675 RepID=A0A8X8ZX10_SALSN|nr:uncharacterized protein LOC121808496 [Salvia splendens]KAG6420103.1 hypothetical protein SASPL_116620 [Salvia splendens]